MSCEEFIERCERELPDMCRCKDLIALGIYRSHQAARYAREKKNGPDYFHIPRSGIVYPKKAVITFLKSTAHKGSKCVL